MKTNRNHRIAGVTVAVLIAVGIVTVLSRTRTTVAAITSAPPEVEVAAVQQRDLPIEREWIGTLDGMVNAAIKAQVTGYLLKQNYAEGSFVRKGQLLFEIDARPFQAAADQASGQLAQASAQLAQAQAGLAAIASRSLPPPKPTSARRSSMKTATCRSRSSRPSRSRIWTTPRRIISR